MKPTVLIVEDEFLVRMDAIDAGGGKSTLARRLAMITGLPLHAIDKLQFETGGAAVPHDKYLKLHSDLLAQEAWIIDGHGDPATLREWRELIV